METPTESDKQGNATPKSGAARKAAKQPAPWSVRGVSLEARAKAAKAARRRRMTLGEWVDNALIAMANEELGTGPALARTVEPGASSERAVALETEAAPAQAAPAEKTAPVAEPSRELVAVSQRLAKIDKLHDALTALGQHLEARERRERNMLVMMHNLSERAKQNESKIAGLLDMVSGLVSRGLPWIAPAAHGAPVTATTTPLAGAALPRSQTPAPHPGSIPPTLAPEAPGPAQAPARAGVPATRPAALPMLNFEKLNAAASANAKRAQSALPPAEPSRGLFAKILGRAGEDEIV